MEITIDNLTRLLKKLERSARQKAKHCRDNGLESMYALQMKKAQTLRIVIWLMHDQKFFDDLFEEWVTKKSGGKDEK